MSHLTVRTLVAAASLAVLGTAGSAAVVSTSIPLAPNADSIGGSAGQVLPLSSSGFLACTQGPDSNDSSADDKTLLVLDIGAGAPKIVVLDTPYLPGYSGHPVRLSATRVLLITAGADGTWKGADDGLHLLSELGSANNITPITTGAIDASDAYIPAALDGNTVVLQTMGPDGVRRTADDTVALVSGLDGTPSVQHLPAPFLTGNGSGRTVVLSPTSFLVASYGADATDATADDLVYLFTDVGGTNTRASLATPFVDGSGSAVPVALSAYRALVCGVGPDRDWQTADDEVHVLDGLDASPTVTQFALPGLMQYGASRPVCIDSQTALISTAGTDLDYPNADDSVALLTDIGTTNTISHITVGFISENAVSRPSLLAPDAFTIGTAGPDGTFENGDDEMLLVSDFLGTPTIVRHAYSGLDAGQSSIALPLGTDALLFSNAGPDGELDAGDDDRITVLTGARTATPTVEHIDMDGENNTFWASQQPIYLGAGRAAFLMGGADSMITTGSDDVFQVLQDLPSERDLRIKKAKLTWKTTKPQKGAGVSVKGTMVVGGVDPFAGLFVTVSAGNASQQIPLDMFKFKRGTWKYADPKRRNGWVKKFTWKPKNGQFSLSGKGLDTGIEMTAASYVVVAVDGGESYLGEAVVGQSGAKGGVKYKAPKN